MGASIAARLAEVALILGAACIALVCVASAGAVPGERVAPGWATGGDPRFPASQHLADAAGWRQAIDCGVNSAVLLRVRGSGEEYGDDALGAWTAAAGTALIAKGWRVRDLQGRYPAPEVPFVQNRKAFIALAAGGLAATALVVKSYRDAASRTWRDVRSDLVAAATRCEGRMILVAAYSQGGIVLRYVIPSLPLSIRNRIRAVDLVADPTADNRVDRGLRRSGPHDARATLEGVDTYGARTWNFLFKQTTYPSDIASRTSQYCRSYDLVCDANPRTTLVDNWFRAGKAHTGYSWAAIGRATAHRQPDHQPRPTTPATPAIPAPPAPAPTPPPPVGAPSPPPLTLTVYNKVTNGATQMREDTPAYLSTVTRNFCRRDGCMVTGTERSTGGTYTPAVCQAMGDRTTNGHDGSATDDANPGLFESRRWYGIRLSGGALGYISEVWISPSQRGGLGLPGC